MPNTITAANLLENSKSFVGHEYKILMEVGFYLFRHILTKRVDGEQDPEPITADQAAGIDVGTLVDDDTQEIQQTINLNDDVDLYFSGEEESDSDLEHTESDMCSTAVQNTSNENNEIIQQPLRRGRPRRFIHEPSGDTNRMPDIDDKYLRDPDTTYLDTEQERASNGRVLTKLGIAWVAGAQLCCLLYVKEIPSLDTYLSSFSAARDCFVAALDDINQVLLKRKAKLHLLYHVPRCVELYGPLRNYMSEMHERQNGEIRG
jgi:hypothetical protein